MEIPIDQQLLSCDWLISNLFYQAIEQVYLLKWPVSVYINCTNSGDQNQRTSQVTYVTLVPRGNKTLRRDAMGNAISVVQL